MAAVLCGPAYLTDCPCFFSSGLSPSILSEFMLRRLVPPGKPLFLSLPFDRTHWRLGRTDVNVLCLGLLHDGVSIPLESMALGKAGNSNTTGTKKAVSPRLALP